MVAASKATNRDSASACLRGDATGSNRSKPSTANGAFGQRAATSTGRQPGGFSQTCSLSSQRVARHESRPSSA